MEPSKDHEQARPHHPLQRKAQRLDRLDQALPYLDDVCRPEFLHGLHLDGRLSQYVPDEFQERLEHHQGET